LVPIFNELLDVTVRYWRF